MAKDEDLSGIEESLEKIADRIDDAFVSDNESPNFRLNAADGLFAIANALAHGFKWLGNADASTPMGALEALGAVILESAERISTSIDGLADAVAKQRRRHDEDADTED